MIDKIKEQLQAFNYTLTENDNIILQFALDKTESYIKNYCNILEIPEELNTVVIDMTMAHFLSSKKSIAIEEDSNSTNVVATPSVIQSIKEGDTTVTYATNTNEATPEQKSQEFLNGLIENAERQLIKYRCIQW